MSELIPVRQGNIGGEAVQTVNARELHKFLEAKKDFSNWMKDRIQQYGLENGKDYCLGLTGKGEAQPSGFAANKIEYHLAIDVAKELSMVERNEKGREARKYFIECEKKLKEGLQPQYKLPKTFSEALHMLADSVELVETQKKALELAAPKVAFADAVNDSSNSMDLGVFAKILGTGRTRFFEWLREQGYLMATGTKPYQKFLDNGYFVVIETTFTKGDTTQSYGKTQICGKGQLAIEKKWAESHG